MGARLWPGMRMGEIRALRVEDIKPDHVEISRGQVVDRVVAERAPAIGWLPKA